MATRILEEFMHFFTVFEISDNVEVGRFLHRKCLPLWPKSTFSKNGLKKWIRPGGPKTNCLSAQLFSILLIFSGLSSQTPKNRPLLRLYSAQPWSPLIGPCQNCSEIGPFWPLFGHFLPLLAILTPCRAHLISQPRQAPKWLVFSIDLDYSCSVYAQSDRSRPIYAILSHFYPHFGPPDPQNRPKNRHFLKNWKNRPILASNFHIFGPILTILLVLAVRRHLPYPPDPKTRHFGPFWPFWPFLVLKDNWFWPPLDQVCKNSPNWPILTLFLVTFWHVHILQLHTLEKLKKSHILGSKIKSF